MLVLLIIFILFFLHSVLPDFIEEEAEAYGKSDGVERRRVQ
jgi:hypothetical protein